MNEGGVQQTVAGIIPNWWSIDNNTRHQTPISNHQLPHHSFLAVPPHHHFMPTQSLSASSSSWNNNDDCQELPDSWSQLLLGGLGSGEEDKNMQLLINQSSSNSSSCGVDLKNENPYTTTYNYGPPRDHHQVVVEFQANPNSNNINNHSWSSQMISPKSSCITTLSSNSNNMLDFSHQSLPGKIRIPDPSSPECNSSTATAGGPVSKKAKIQHAPQPQSTFKVRKEKLGDRITALHQMVSPFGKTDTASVLLEAIGYIRFLQSQVEALSLPYLTSGSRNICHQNHVQVERNSLFPEDPGQLLNDKRLKKRGLMIYAEGSCDEEAKKDLRSRGLCLVPISSTLQVGNEMNGADYWAQSAFGGNFQ